MKFMMTTFSLVVLFAASPALAQNPNPEPMLSVQGNGEVRVTPDIALVRLGIAVQDETASQVQQEANRVASAVIDAVLGEGIAERQVQTARLQLSPIYGRQEPGDNDTPRIVGYRASNTVTIRVEDLTRVGAVVDAALGAGANQLEGIGFGLDDDQAAREDALRAAVEEARSKAQVMAVALGVELDGILAINEGGIFIQEPAMAMMESRMAVQADMSTPVAAGEVTVRANVSIQYRIAQ
jgi:hypothetical protein